MTKQYELSFYCPNCFHSWKQLVPIGKEVRYYYGPEAMIIGNVHDDEWSHVVCPNCGATRNISKVNPYDTIDDQEQNRGRGRPRSSEASNPEDFDA